MPARHAGARLRLSDLQLRDTLRARGVFAHEPKDQERPSEHRDTNEGPRLQFQRQLHSV